MSDRCPLCRACSSWSVSPIYWARHFLHVTQYITLVDLHVICCLMVYVRDVCVMLTWLVNVPSLHVLHLLSPHLWNPGGVLRLLHLLWVRETCICFPRGVSNTLPHSSQVVLFLSKLVLVSSMMLLLNGSLLDTSMSFRLRLRLYATRGGLGKIDLHRSLDKSAGWRSLNLRFKSGTTGLYVVENITLLSLLVSLLSLGFRNS